MSVVINGDTGVSGVNGSAATPSIKGGDADTGIFFGTDTASITTGGTSRLSILSSGSINVDSGGVYYDAATNNLGVGVPSDRISSRLHVEDGHYRVGFSDNTTRNNLLMLGYGYRLNDSYFGQTQIRSNYTNTTNTADLRFHTTNTADSNQRMIIDINGSVGIGVDPPTKGSGFGGTQKILHVGGTSAPELRLQSSSSNQGDLSIFASNSGRNSHISSHASNGAINFNTVNSTDVAQSSVFQILGRGIAKGSAAQGLAPSNGSAMFTGFFQSDFRLGITMFNLPGNAWFTCSVFYMIAGVQGGLQSNQHGMGHIRLTGLGGWGLNTTSVIQGPTYTIASANSSSNHVDLDFTMTSGLRGPVSFWVQSVHGAIPELTFTA